jgi:hypothetical protein
MNGMAGTRSVVEFLASTVAGRGSKPRETSTNFDNLKPLAEAIARADLVVLYEGLPHQLFDAQAMEWEIQTKQTFEDHGFRFYTEPLELKPDDAKKLTELATDPATFMQFQGEKLCGGFHPDYLIEWRVGKDVYRMQVCFGCREVQVFGPKSEVRCEMTARKNFAEVLKPYRKNRPVPVRKEL